MGGGAATTANKQQTQTKTKGERMCVCVFRLCSACVPLVFRLCSVCVPLVFCLCSACGPLVFLLCLGGWGNDDDKQTNGAWKLSILMAHVLRARMFLCLLRSCALIYAALQKLAHAWLRILNKLDVTARKLQPAKTMSRPICTIYDLRCFLASCFVEISFNSTAECLVFCGSIMRS